MRVIRLLTCVFRVDYGGYRQLGHVFDTALW
ncbi:hypothetical protein SAMN06297387_1232 [Streptomyces zhaozhouensis]|uniref:Uncharacterized protein n=1 Tax=Streptomyces zhaozhouensis TaxID=1300267 RepID=A0A286E446_9ACTN|nr:hypothetical protein SAMN06297387_1232 [Streptomyces zhaozhouensis]